MALTPYKPGQSGNPGGRPKLSPEWQAIRRLTKDELNRVVSKYAHMTIAQITEAIQNPKIQVIELCVARIFDQTLKTGDSTGLNMLLDRAVGKPAVQPTEIDERRIADQEKRTEIAAHLATMRTESVLSEMTDEQVDKLAGIK
jgi:hypothetical protein